ncbi:protein of unknown function DUF820 [Beutenbergia cavernae DSM 12333]|uniref:Putative restriction endonuclease domain-containing protein n=1 Tax=Beutenbergia cavernae (strain ATCC BAA-8 / DSM 12333 / CCUG 43141 / JCM 11478 / NBRC 16432 / NCIMB 13614 / HKI 0122) TaxID=471853 RepID=C5C063_BEUC1|nr:Uma2 family endonuclease [Beutenbergia cavernae]ACQ79249.1 protein of unknown function DUF820 [Beutenbergia cavernae DSM 12333]
MSAVSTAKSPDVLGLPRGRPLTAADLERMPDDGHRYELIDGTLIVTPAPRIRHQDVVGGVHLALRAAVPSHLKVLLAPTDVVLADDTVLQPDLLVAPRDAFTERNLPTAPLLAVEILSPSTRSIDLILKRDRLARAGCRHYWVVDPDVPEVQAWTLDGDAYRETGHATGDDTLALEEPFAVTLTPSALLDD